ncbi:hypothetical protein HWV62_32672 [Athelia sp. TMB]|nr:hypothetical protein HWV62_32672 [Athelia sp. TMB]
MQLKDSVELAHGYTSSDYDDLPEEDNEETCEDEDACPDSLTLLARQHNCNDLETNHPSPAPSPPASPALSAYSFSSLSDFQPSPVKLPFSVSICFTSSPDLEHEPETNSKFEIEPELEADTPLTSDFPDTSTEYAMPPSSPPASSPHKIFSSSPMASSQSSLPCIDSDGPEKHSQERLEFSGKVRERDGAHTPTTSPKRQPARSSSPFVDADLEFERELYEMPPPLKRARNDEQADQDIDIAEPSQITEPSRKRAKFDIMTTLPLPSQKRPTFASQTLEHKKLAKPFRPLSIKPRVLFPENVPRTEPAGPVSPSPLAPSPKSLASNASNRNRTSRAAAQFKSPLAGSSAATPSSIRLTPTIQGLERKVQILKRAVKVRQEGDEATLEGLVKKWIEAGREVAWEVWGLVKDMGGDVVSATKASKSEGWGDAEKPKGKNKRGFEEGWGWDDADGKKKAKGNDGFERNWGWSIERTDDSGVDGDDEAEGGKTHGVPCEEEQEEEIRQDTLGTMLRQLGIDPCTLGWNEEEGEFVDDAPVIAATNCINTCIENANVITNKLAFIMPANPFVLVTPATRGLSLALTRQFLKTTKFPVYATHRSGSADEHKENILSTLKDVDSDRLTLLKLDLTSEDSIGAAADALSSKAGNGSYLHTGFFTGGMLHPEKQPSDLDMESLQATFQTNVISHLLLIKHFSRFLPKRSDEVGGMAKWVHVSARVGSISDNKRGGWYSYRSSKAALNQVIKTWDLQLQMKKTPSMCVGVHPGTVKTDLSKDYWTGTPKDGLFEPDHAAEMLVDVVANLEDDQRGKLWGCAGKEIPW